MSSASATASGHVLGRSSEEHEHLRRPAPVGQNERTTRLDRVSLATGTRCLSVGCPPGEAMRPRANRVGPADATASCADHSLLWNLLMGIHKRQMDTGR
jgi:hypothetical protein